MELNLNSQTSSISLTSSQKNYDHAHIIFGGGIKIIGDRHIDVDEAYQLISAEIKHREYNEYEKDTVDLILWAISQNPDTCIKKYSDHSVCFGSNAKITTFIPPKHFMILTDRQSIPESHMTATVVTSNTWRMGDNDWELEISLQGTTRKVPKCDIIEVGLVNRKLYVRSDKYNNYK
ncbi:TPA_asm: M [Argyranthemum gammacytorhabdovirus 1]|nr:TPA_asm: M [Argyranthemum gammacytorhabdovirus 1]